jgi:hypothetical protein
MPKRVLTGKIVSAKKFKNTCGPSRKKVQTPGVKESFKKIKKISCTL